MCQSTPQKWEKSKTFYFFCFRLFLETVCQDTLVILLLSLCDVIKGSETSPR